MRVTRNLNSDVQSAIRAARAILDHVEAPGWLADAPPGVPGDADVIPCRNGLLIVSRQADGPPPHLIDHSTNYFTLGRLAFDYDAAAPEPVEWLKFLESIWPGGEEAKDFLAEHIGYALTDDNRIQKNLMLIGSPRSGKGVILRCIEQLVGDGLVCLSLLTRLGRPFGLTQVVGKRVLALPDTRVAKDPRENNLAVEARSLGRGGIATSATATGLSDRTIRTGLKERADPAALPPDRQRRVGGGRTAHRVAQPGLTKAPNRLIEPTARGTPTGPGRWTIKSTYRLADELRRKGFVVGPSLVRSLLRDLDYSLQANRKTQEGRQHPDRDGQFRHISGRVTARRRRGEPAVSVDTKKKEVLGNLKNPGQAYRPRGDSRKVKTHDSPDPELGKAVPYGVYDIHHNEAGVSVGISHDTAEFAVGAIRRWWDKVGRKRYGRAKRVLVTADSGGSNSARGRLLKVGLQKWADETGLVVEVCHYPPGTSK